MAETEHLASKQQVEEFYDTFKEQQKKLGVNIRHRTIFKNLKKIGLNANSNVLEIGCGIGTVSSLIIKHCGQGSFVGVDISKESIQLAKEIYAPFKNAEFIVSDMSDFSYAKKFDFVVLPDVLEHIPVSQHSNLFKILSTVTSENVTILANFPEPDYLDWLRKTNPEKLQIIDQSLSMQDLLNNTYPHGFKLISMNSYSLQYEQTDYISLVFKKNEALTGFTKKSKLTLGLQNLISKF